MSADLLREAAAKMRERAEASSPSPWVQTVWPKEVPGVYSQAIEDTHEFDPEIARTLDKPDAEHIASWHPAVALAVADWLDAEAGTEERLSALAHRDSVGSIRDEAIAVARAYLGSDK